MSFLFRHWRGIDYDHRDDYDLSFYQQQPSQAAIKNITSHQDNFMDIIKVYILQQDTPSSKKGDTFIYVEAGSFSNQPYPTAYYKSGMVFESEFYLREQVEDNPDWFLPQAEVERISLEEQRKSLLYTPIVLFWKDRADFLEHLIGTYKKIATEQELNVWHLELGYIRNFVALLLNKDSL